MGVICAEEESSSRVRVLGLLRAEQRVELLALRRHAALLLLDLRGRRLAAQRPLGRRSLRLRRNDCLARRRLVRARLGARRPRLRPEPRRRVVGGGARLLRALGGRPHLGAQPLREPPRLLRDLLGRRLESCCRRASCSCAPMAASASARSESCDTCVSTTPCRTWSCCSCRCAASNLASSSRRTAARCSSASPAARASCAAACFAAAAAPAAAASASSLARRSSASASRRAALASAAASCMPSWLAPATARRLTEVGDSWVAQRPDLVRRRTC